MAKHIPADIFDDLINDDAPPAELSGAAIRDLEKLEAPPRVEIGVPTALILMWDETICRCCGATYGAPHFAGAPLFLKRTFRTRSEYTPLQSPDGIFTGLPRRIEITRREIHVCPACYENRPADSPQLTLDFSQHAAETPAVDSPKESGEETFGTHYDTQQEPSNDHEE